MEVKGSKIKVTAYYKKKKYTRIFDLEEYREKKFDSRLLAKWIMSDLRTELMGTALTFDHIRSGFWDLLNAFLANALIRGYFRPMSGKIELQTDVKADIYFEPIEGNHIGEHVT